jgi:hypothetical protein
MDEAFIVFSRQGILKKSIQTNALVGYQYRNGESNAHPEQDLWIFQRGIKDRDTFEEYRVLPKRLAEPISRIIEVLNRLGI